jgi:acetolactate synthase I/II/III large subunit
MPKITTGGYLAETLKAHGIGHVFAVPAIFHSAMVAMEETGTVRVTPHHEMAAAFMADGYARAGRKPGICLGQAVGAGNVAAGLRDAYQTGAPVIAITGGPHPDSRYRYLYQIVEDFQMFQPVTKFNARVDKPERFPDLLRQAFRAATTGSPGPVHLELPGRLGEGAQGEIDAEVIVEPQYGCYPAHRPEAPAHQVAEAARILAGAERPVIVAGGGVTSSDAGAELVRLAELLSIPVATTPNGKGAIPESHPLAIGLVGTYGRASANQALSESDLVFFAGSRAGGLATGNWRFPPPGTATLQLDIDPAEVGRNYPARAGLVGDAKAVLRQLGEAVSPVSREEWVARVQAMLAGWRKEVAPELESDAVPMRPERLCQEITEALPDNALLVADTGHAAIWTGTMVELRHPGQRYLRCAGTLGWAFPAALGAKCALPDTPVLCFTGDGGIMYHLGELETAARVGINAVILVNNNASLQQVKKGIDTAYGGSQWGRANEMWVFKDVNFARVAEEMGCLGIRVEKPTDLRQALERAFIAGRPAVIDVVTDVAAVPAWG